MAFLAFSWTAGVSRLVLLLAAICLVFVIVGLVRLAFSPGSLPVVLMAIGSMRASIGVMFVVGGSAGRGRIIAVTGVALAIAGFFLEQLSRRR